MPSSKSPERAGVLGIRRRSSHRKKVADSCSREAVEKEGAGACLSYQKRLASSAERDGGRLNSDVAEIFDKFSGNAARCILFKC